MKSWRGPAVRVLALVPALVAQVAWWLGSSPVSEPVLMKALPAALALVALWRPFTGVVMLAGGAPVVGLIATWGGLEHPASVLLEQLVLAVVTGAIVRNAGGTATRLGLPGACFAAVVAASAAVAMPSWLLMHGMRPTASEGASLIWNGAVFSTSTPWLPMRAAMWIAEGLALAWVVERSVRARPTAGPPVLLALVAGSTVAAASNLVRAAEVAASQGQATVVGVLAVLASVRFNTQFDVNAAGSMFVMVLLASVAIMSEPRWLRLPVMISIPVIAAGGLWASGSRAAMLSAGVGILAALLLPAVANQARRRRAASAALVVVVLGVGAVWMYPATRNFSMKGTVDSRLILYRAAVEMWRDAPLTGVGIGTFRERSEQYGAAAIDDILHSGRTRENAHNYFLQVLAELGLSGLGVFLWVMGAACVPAVVAVLKNTTTSIGGPWLVAGGAAFLLTSVTGHPQLVLQAVVPFWFILGLIAASVSPRQPPGRAARIAVAVAFLALVVSVPARSERARDRAQLEHIGIGLSLWHTDADGTRYRQANQAFSVFGPTGQAVTLPLRLSPASPSPATADVCVDGRRISRVELRAAGWFDMRVLLPARRRDFIEIRVVPSEGAVVWAGKIVGRPVR